MEGRKRFFTRIEKAVLWVPPNEGTPVTLLYQVEVIDVVSSPKVAKQRVPAEGSQTNAAGSGQQ